MKQLIIFINRLVSSANVGIDHKFMSPGTNANEVRLVVVPIRTQQIRK